MGFRPHESSVLHEHSISNEIYIMTTTSKPKTKLIQGLINELTDNMPMAWNDERDEILTYLFCINARGINLGINDWAFDEKRGFQSKTLAALVNDMYDRRDFGVAYDFDDVTSEALDRVEDASENLAQFEIIEISIREELEVTDEDFSNGLDELVDELGSSYLMSIPEVRGIVAEHLNNEVLKRLEDE